MKWFKKKKTYLVSWCDNPRYEDDVYKELVRAVDKVDAWNQVTKKHYNFISLIDIKEIKEE